MPNAKSRTQEAFLVAHGRSPDREEAARAMAFLEERKEHPADGVANLLWALLTSAEFLTVP